ncbi:hypothetical protein SLS61_008582 [Didymella pomorum]
MHSTTGRKKVFANAVVVIGNPYYWLESYTPLRSRSRESSSRSIKTLATICAQFSLSAYAIPLVRISNDQINIKQSVRITPCTAELPYKDPDTDVSVSAPPNKYRTPSKLYILAETLVDEITKDTVFDKLQARYEKQAHHIDKLLLTQVLSFD